MKRIFLLGMVLLLMLVPILAGCSSKQTKAGQEAVIPKDTATIDTATIDTTTKDTMAKDATVKNSDPKNTANTANISDDSNLKEFTLEELAEYDGTNGKPAYVAVKGIVYDITEAKLWKGGIHSPMSAENVAGKDLTAELAEAPPSHQSQEFWKKVPQVGILKETSK